MATYADYASLWESLLDCLRQYTLNTWLAIFSAAAAVGFFLLYLLVFFAAPIPRPAQRSEKTFLTVSPNGTLTEPQELPCWLDRIENEQATGDSAKGSSQIDEAEIFMSVVVPAYNEEKRLGVMLEEAVKFLNLEYPDGEESVTDTKVRGRTATHANGSAGKEAVLTSWEILIVSDGSTDATSKVALDFAKANPGGSIRVIELKKNRGKGGAVVHGLRHVRGKYVVFADADGASKFEDLRKLVDACPRAQDRFGRAVAVGSRAHLVGSEAVVKRSKLRNFLMHSFHLLLWFFTPAATSRIKDTQCGFKLFTRPSLPFIVPHMHSEGWIFDVEMLMLAEKAQIPMIEVAIAWKEVSGSKLNPLVDSLGMARDLFILRAAWAFGIYSVK